LVGHSEIIVHFAQNRRVSIFNSLRLETRFALLATAEILRRQTASKNKIVSQDATVVLALLVQGGLRSRQQRNGPVEGMV